LEKARDRKVFAWQNVDKFVLLDQPVLKIRSFEEFFCYSPNFHSLEQ
jgi:hypothetical protein